MASCLHLQTTNSKTEQNQNLMEFGSQSIVIYTTISHYLFKNLDPPFCIFIFILYYKLLGNWFSNPNLKVMVI